jgi:hypothetical protein
MNSSSNAHSSAQQAGQHAKTQARPWIVALARLGYAARGVVYAVIGLLAFQSARGAGGKATDPQGALLQIAQQPFGRVMLSVVGIGLLGYALWRLVQTAFDPEGKGTDAKGIATRFGYALSGLISAGLAYTAFKIVIGRRGNGSSSQQDWTARLLSQPAGQWLIGIVGLIIIGMGLYAFYQVYSAKFREKLKTQEMSHNEDVWITRFGRAGFAARGVVWSIIAGFSCARQLNPTQKKVVVWRRHLPHWARNRMAPGCWALSPVASSPTGYTLWQKPAIARFLCEIVTSVASG